MRATCKKPVYNITFAFISLTYFFLWFRREYDSIYLKYLAGITSKYHITFEGLLSYSFDMYMIFLMQLLISA